MSLSNNQLQQLAHLGDMYNSASTQREKDYYHQVANDIRSNAGLRAGVDYASDSGASLNGTVTIPTGRVSGGSQTTAGNSTPTVTNQVVGSGPVAVPVQVQPSLGSTFATNLLGGGQAVVGKASDVPTPIEQASKDALTPLQASSAGSSGLDKLVPIGALGMVLIIFMRLVR